ncbi:hypothetical protein N44_01100 [Microcystis aeruginosa NIES-44]|uniref:Uncharacterized protein n=1 Tax=Microcystis aeruginosa NIES-44 TaxID=449439 RepID=A0A0A1VRU6_MICAE|nr:hypothetical protein N44_01100 [Microcystis aeruginosa NIES-44]
MSQLFLSFIPLTVTFSLITGYCLLITDLCGILTLIKL